MNKSIISIRDIITFLILIILTLTENIRLLSEKPRTIPAIKEWIDVPGSFKFSAKSKIVIDKNYYDELIETAQTFSEDLLAQKKYKPEIIKGDSANSSDFFLTLSIKDSSVGNEGYEMFVGDKIQISAVTPDGIFYGTRTILQMIKNTNTINGGYAKDYPQFPERAFMVDIGRKYFSMEWMENQIRELAYIKMNYFHWHISDDIGFRIESISHPEITSEQHYTQKEIKHLLYIARKYHVIIIPEIDMPGHMGAILRNNLDKYALKEVNGNIIKSFMDITEESSRKFAEEIITEFIDLFPGPFWHGGTDEYIYDNFDNFPQFLNYSKKIYGNNAIAVDAIIDFVNWMNRLVREKGKTLRIWNDAITKLKNKGGKAIADTNIIIEYWQGEDEPNDIVKSGYSIINCSIDFFYYNMGTSWIEYNKYLYEEWKPNIFQGEKIVSDYQNKIRGSKYHVWCENPDIETEGHIALVIRFPMRILSQSLWNSNKLVTEVSQFKTISDTIGLAPGVFYPENPTPGNIAFRKKVSSESNFNSFDLPPEHINDGNRNTQWRSGIRDCSWIFVDLEDTFKIKEMRLIWFHTPPKEFLIQVSDDSLNWYTIRYYKDEATRIMDIKELDATGRFVRLYFTEHLDSGYYSLWEIEIYGNEYSNIDFKNDLLINNAKVFPNPFDNNVKIEFHLNSDTDISIKVFDFSGKVADSIYDGHLLKGWQTLYWNGANYSGGEYNIFIKAGNNALNLKTVLNR